MTLYQDIMQYANDKKTVALSFKSKKITYHDLLHRIDIMALKLTATGIFKDMVVTLLSPSIPEAIITLYALNKIGAIVSLLHPDTPKETLEESILYTHSQVTILFEGYYTRYQEKILTLNQQFLYLSALPDLTLIDKGRYLVKYQESISKPNPAQLLNSCSKLKTEEERADFDLNMDENKISILLRKSSTFEKLKTILLCDREFSYLANQAKDIFPFELNGMTLLNPFPLYTPFSLACGIHLPLVNHMSVQLMLHLDTTEIANLINRNQLHILLLTPYLINRLLDDVKFISANLKNLKWSLAYSPQGSTSLFEQFNRIMQSHGSLNRVYETYMSFEGASLLTLNTPIAHRQKSVGKPLKKANIKIVDPANRKIELEPNQIGEILYNGPNMCLGYYNTDKRKQPFFTDQRRITYLGTGDLGYIDSDGYLYITKTNESNVFIADYPICLNDIETLAKEVPGVIEAAALYIEKRKHPYVHLFIENHKEDDDELKERVKTYLNARLFRYAQPKKISVLPHFPRTSLGKIDRKALIHF